MVINLNQAQASVPVTILSVEGDVDGSNFKELVNKAQETISADTRALLLDLTLVKYISSAGLLAIQAINGMLHGELRVLNPQPHVDRALEMAGFKQFLQIYTDRDTALASF